MNTAEVDLWQGSRIGVFGGTFDPPHEGHVRMAVHAREALGLDRVLFSVAPRPPHKSAGSTTAFEHRVEMVRLAIHGADGLALTHIEEPDDVSYTVDLLRGCRERTRADLYFIMGADSLEELPGWKDPEEILSLATLVVFARDDRPMRLGVPGPAALVVFETPRIDVSSTTLREQLERGESAPDLLPAAVADYAGRNGLYRRHGGA